MLRDFIAARREQILVQARLRFAARVGPLAAEDDFAHGLPTFLDHLREALRRVFAREPIDHDAIQLSAGEHGDELFHRGASLAQLVHDYGDVGQVIRSLADAEHATIAVDEAQTLSFCIDDAVTGAVAAYTRHRERAISDEGSRRLGAVAHEMRGELNDAIMAFASIRKGVSPPSGSTSAILDRSLMRLNALIDRSLAGVRLDLGTQNAERVPVWELVEELEIGASMIARARGVLFVVTSVDETVVVQADRQVLAAAVANLLQNALEFTHPGRTVFLKASTTARRVLIEIKDQCGGLSPEETLNLLHPFGETGRDRDRLSLGLPMCVRAVNAIGGDLRVHDVPCTGCVFTIDLPKQSPAPTPIGARERKPPEVPVDIEPKRLRGR
jgi:signal transduction histidine kinase